MSTIGVKKHNMNGQNASKVRPLYDDLGSVQVWELPNQFVDKVLVFDLGENNLTSQIQKNSDVFFCMSQAVLPKGFRLVTDCIEVGEQIDEIRTESIVLNSQPIDENENTFIHFIHSINSDDTIKHPCINKIP